MKPLTILDDNEYFSEITQNIANTKSGDRVALMTMSFEPTEQRTGMVLHELYAAASRGVKVQLNIDAICFMLTKKILPSAALLKQLKPEQLNEPVFKTRYAALQKLRECGGQFCITNIPSHRLSNPFAGRSHVKFTVINNDAYIGGCNLGQSWQIDLMVRISDQPTADWIYDFELNVDKSGKLLAMLHGEDEEHAINDTSTLLIDSGKRQQSLIFERAIGLIDQAREWIVLTCQYFPGNTTARHLLVAQKRGVAVTIYFGNNAHHKGLRWPHEFAELRDRTKYPKEFFERRLDRRLPRLHAKLLATENGAMIGSHNYVTQGVRFGTAESTLVCRELDFANQAVEVFKARLAEAGQEAGLQ